MTRVLIKASPLLRAGLDSLIRDYPSIQIIGDPSEELPDSDDTPADLQPDVIVAELESHDEESSAEWLHDANSGVPVILLVRGPTPDWTDALRQGVKAVLPTNASGPQIAAAIEAVAAGLTVFHPDQIAALGDTPRMHEPPEALPEALTPREIEVLRAMAEGLGNKEIASRLGISEHTAKFHVASVMGKLGAASRTEAVILGIRRGLVFI
jgi:DNA-binding NarL/FixJ family response regulator